jgi:hypothetical protein
VLDQGGQHGLGKWDGAEAVLPVLDGTEDGPTTASRSIWRSIVTERPRVQVTRSFVRPRASEIRTPVPAPRKIKARYRARTASMSASTVSIESGTIFALSTFGSLISRPASWR